MKALSASTLMSDPYRAGVALGEALQSIDPEVVLIFSAIYYGDNTELVEGLSDTLKREDLIIIGSSSDGFYESKSVSDHGVAALGLNSEGKITWRTASATGVAEKTTETTREALAALNQTLNNQAPALIILFSDFRADGSQIEKVLHDEVHVPVVGGFAADDNRMQNCVLFYNREIIRDGVVLLAACGPLQFDILVGNTLPPVGHPGVVRHAEGTLIRDIDGIGGMDFIERETGKPVLQTDRGVVTLTVIDADRPQRKRLRSIVPDFGDKNASLGLYGGIEAGARVQVCLANPEQLVEEIHLLAKQTKDTAFAPKAALVVSCIGRKQVLGTSVTHEVDALANVFPEGLPLAGFPSFGEIGPLKEDGHFTPNMFHNMTYVLLLLG